MNSSKFAWATLGMLLALVVCLGLRLDGIVQRLDEIRDMLQTLQK